MTRILSALLLGLAASAPAAADAAAPAAPAGKAVVLSGADLYTVSHGVIPGGELLIRDGKIAALGAHVDAPADAARIELKGRRIYPGYIAADSILGLTEVEAVRATNDFTEVGAINPNVRAEVAVNPDSELIAVARANGVLTALVVPQGGREPLHRAVGSAATGRLDLGADDAQGAGGGAPQLAQCARAPGCRRKRAARPRKPPGSVAPNSTRPWPMPAPTPPPSAPAR